MMLKTRFILASQSPRRRQLLEQIGLRFDVVASPFDEVLTPGVPPVDLVRGLARQKAEPVAAIHPDALTLGADTVVVLDGEVLGKPPDGPAACAMLRRLSGRRHTVYTGVALLHPASARAVTAVEGTGVTFATLNERDIQAYVDGGSPLDKAGAYGIQDHRGPLFVSGIDGDYYNVVGLPLHRLYRTLQEHFGDLLA